MNKKVSISIEEIQELHKRMREINSHDLSDIEFTEDGIPIDIDPKIIEQFKFCGLNNKDFIMTDFYKSGFDNIKNPY
ncbi:MAG: hypothetical protein SLAVMIC_00727 [uncultured marine phage]|uniref:Uncharacterized protein n=1 Tax=uncultured marine phage TaxID=707152 RepID=A0A8D9CDJ0_9VIRU|nr:MAG: hypothetical protein SLAVMIC_00727 [uncultured marine phage]